MKQESRFSPPAVGGSSLLVIFAVLTLSVFAMLSLSTVQAEKRISDASARSVTAYYEADRQAEEVYARLRNGETVPEVTVSDGVYSYHCYISENQYLAVALTSREGAWQILRWQAVASPEPIADNTLPVWDGN